MKKNFLTVLALALIFSLLTACSGTPASTDVPTVKQTTESSTTETVTGSPETPSDTDQPPTEPLKVGKWALSLNTGSAKTLTGNCVVFMIFLSDAESTVDDAAREDYLRYMKEADDFLTAQAAACGQTLNLIYGEDDLMLAYMSPTLLPSEMDYNWSLQMLWETGQGYDFETIAARYDADNIAYVLWLNKRGDFCYASPVNTSPGGVNDSAEVCVMYTYSVGSDNRRHPMASASVLAHELIHLFGAVDLYPGSNRTEADNDLLNTVYSSDLMRYGTGNLSEKTLCEIDKFLVGWIPSLAEDLWRFINWWSYEY